uniref:Metalloproteinase inhibitor 2 n=1 Tax=Equus asinus TaxID=9793 RepID=A0A9L0IJQ6_EQUAS
MGAAARSLQLALGLLLLGTLLRPADACSCSPVHPQQAFCNADVVIRAKAVSEKEVDSGNDIYGNPIKRIQYEIKQIKMFKGPDKDIEFIYTAPSSAVCGVSLDVGGKKEYLIAGKAEGNGKMHITLCDFIVPWDTLSTTQKKSLNHRYQMGCECKVSRDHLLLGFSSSPPPPGGWPGFDLGLSSVSQSTGSLGQGSEETWPPTSEAVWLGTEPLGPGPCRALRRTSAEGYWDGKGILAVWPVASRREAFQEEEFCGEDTLVL